ncbi:MAG: single-stranded DNA-binding protein [Acidaminococcaceae bacterium]|nr:single-stranded DNA-binding protein [Acidaminococcaceae bacterium]
MNQLTIIGNLTRDPELRTTSAGISVCSFTVAVNRKKQGQQPEADYFSVSAWRERGENCAKFLLKGKKVCVVGPVSVRTYQAQNGETRAQMEVTADEVEFLTPRTEGQPAQHRQVDQQTQMEVVETDDLPF